MEIDNHALSYPRHPASCSQRPLQSYDGRPAPSSALPLLPSAHQCLRSRRHRV